MKERPTRRHAVVLGRSMAGPLAARVLSAHADRVTIVDRDTLPAEPGTAPGFPSPGTPTRCCRAAARSCLG